MKNVRGVAQLGPERLLGVQEIVGSNPTAPNFKLHGKGIRIGAAERKCKSTRPEKRRHPTRRRLADRSPAGLIREFRERIKLFCRTEAPNPTAPIFKMDKKI